MRVLILTIVFLIVTQFGFIEAHVAQENQQSINDELKQHRQNRFLIFPESVHGNGTNWSPLGSLMDKWNQLIDWKIAKINSVKSLMCNLILKGAFNCATKDAPANKQSIIDHLLNKFKMPQSTTTTTIKPDQQPATNEDNKETTTTDMSTTDSSTPPPTSTTTTTRRPGPTSTSTAPSTSQSPSPSPSSSTTTTTTTTRRPGPRPTSTSTAPTTSRSTSQRPSSSTTTTPSSLPEDTSDSLNEI